MSEPNGKLVHEHCGYELWLDVDEERNEVRKNLWEVRSPTGVTASYPGPTYGDAELDIFKAYVDGVLGELRHNELAMMQAIVSDQERRADTLLAGYWIAFDREVMKAWPEINKPLEVCTKNGEVVSPCLFLMTGSAGVGFYFHRDVSVVEFEPVFNVTHFRVSLLPGGIAIAN